MGEVAAGSSSELRTATASGFAYHGPRYTPRQPPPGPVQGVGLSLAASRSAGTLPPERGGPVGASGQDNPERASAARWSIVSTTTDLTVQMATRTQFSRAKVRNPAGWNRSTGPWPTA